MKFGEIVREIRKEKRIGQPELARLTGLKQTAISQIETGKRDPFMSTAKKILNALDYDIFIGEATKTKTTNKV